MSYKLKTFLIGVLLGLIISLIVAYILPVFINDGLIGNLLILLSYPGIVAAFFMGEGGSGGGPHLAPTIIAIVFQVLFYGLIGLGVGKIIEKIRNRNNLT